MLKLRCTLTPLFSVLCEPQPYMSIICNRDSNNPTEFALSSTTQSLLISVPISNNKVALQDIVLHFHLFAHHSDPRHQTFGQKLIDTCSIVFNRVLCAFFATHTSVSDEISFISTHGKFRLQISIPHSTLFNVSLTQLLKQLDIKQLRRSDSQFCTMFQKAHDLHMTACKTTIVASSWDTNVHNPCLWLTHHTRDHHCAYQQARDGCRKPYVITSYSDYTHALAHAPSIPIEFWNKIGQLSVHQFRGDSFLERLERLAFVVRFIACNCVFLDDEIDTCVNETRSDTIKTMSMAERVYLKSVNNGAPNVTPRVNFEFRASSTPTHLDVATETKIDPQAILASLQASKSMHEKTNKHMAPDDHPDCPLNAQNMGLTGEDCESLARAIKFYSDVLQKTSKKSASSTIRDCIELSEKFDFVYLTCSMSQQPRTRRVTNVESDHEDEEEFARVTRFADRVSYVQRAIQKECEIMDNLICHVLLVGIPVATEELWVSRGKEMLKILYNEQRSDVINYCKKLRNNSKVDNSAPPIIAIEATRFRYTRQGTKDKTLPLETDVYLKLYDLFEDTCPCKSFFKYYNKKADLICEDQKRAWNRYYHGVHVHSTRLLLLYNESDWFLMDLHRNYKDDVYPRLAVDLNDWFDVEQRDRFVLIPACGLHALNKGLSKEKEELLNYMNSFEVPPRVHKTHVKSDAVKDPKKNTLILYARSVDWNLCKDEFQGWCKANKVVCETFEMKLFETSDPYIVLHLNL